MSDYLGNLVARSFTPNADVRPRIPSIFESPREPALLEQPVDPDGSSEIQTSPALPKNAMPARPEIIQWPRPAATSPTNPRKHSKKDLGPAPSASIDQTVGLKTDTDLNHRPSEPPPSRVPVAIRPAVHPRIEAEEKSSPTPAPQTRPLEKVESLIRPSPDLDQSEAPKNGELAAATLGASARAKDFVSAPNGISIRPVQPAREANQVAVAARVPTASAAATLSTIQVTIGRLEVRASVPAAAMPRAKLKNEPVMSLETYLQRRAEGGRR
jgi:hypothetical protein